jgi:hypothetical protein
VAVDVDVETVSVEEAVPPTPTLTLGGLNDSVRPEGEPVAARFTIPEKLPPAVTVTLV